MEKSKLIHIMDKYAKFNEWVDNDVFNKLSNLYQIHKIPAIGNILESVKSNFDPSNLFEQYKKI